MRGRGKRLSTEKKPDTLENRQFGLLDPCASFTNPAPCLQGHVNKPGIAHGAGVRGRRAPLNPGVICSRGCTGVAQRRRNVPRICSCADFGFELAPISGEKLGPADTPRRAKSLVGPNGETLAATAICLSGKRRYIKQQAASTVRSPPRKKKIQCKWGAA